MLNVHTLEVILSGHGKVVHGVTHPVVDLSAALHGVLLLHHLILDGLGQLAHQLSNVKALPLLELVDDCGAVLLEDVLAELLLLGVTSLLHVGHALVGVRNLLDRVTVVLVTSLVDLVGGVVGVVDGLVLIVTSAGTQGLDVDGVTGLCGASKHTGDQQ